MATEVKEATVRPINRLKSMYPLRAFLDETNKQSRKASEAGRPVAWGMLGIPTPILTNMGIEAVFPENFAPLCASSGTAAGFLERADAEGYPTNLCGYCRNGLGYSARMADLDGEIPPESPGAGMPKPVVMVGNGASCDARVKFMQAVGRYLDVPFFLVESRTTWPREALMAGAHERHIQSQVKAYKELVAFLEDLTGNKMDWDKIGNTGDNVELSRIWWAINEMRSEIPCPMHARDSMSAMSGALFKLGDPQKWISLYGDMYDEVKDRVANRVAGINYEERYRITFQGLPPWHSLGFLDELAKRGWNFVHGPYHPGQPEEIDVSHISDPMERYVRANSRRSLADTIDRDFVPAKAAEIKEEIIRMGYSPRLGIEHARDFRCDGAFLHSLLTCRWATAPLLIWQKHAMDIHKVPSLLIQGDIIDTTLFDPNEAVKKAEAFEETMDYYREVRRKEGLEW